MTVYHDHFYRFDPPHCVVGKHGRVLRMGQIWQYNDPRELRAVRLIVFFNRARGGFEVTVENVVTHKHSIINVKHFTIGQRGWSLLKEVR